MINYIVINLQLQSFTKQRYTHYTVYKCTTTCLRNVIFVEAPGAFLKVYFCHTVFTALRAKSTGTWQDRHESLFMEFPAATGWERDCMFNKVQSCWFTFHFKRPKAPTFICLLYVQHKRDIKRILKYDKVATTTTISPGPQWMQNYWGCKFDQVWAIIHQQCWLIQEVQEVMGYKQDVNPTLWCQQCHVKSADQWISDSELTVIVVAFGEVRAQVNIHCQPSVNHYRFC